MADMGNMLAEYGADPSILEQVDRRRADRTVNQLNEAKLYMAGDEMNRANQLRGAYGRLQAGDKSADAEIAGLDPAFHQTMKTNIAALNESNRKILEAESDKVGRIMVASMNDEKLWASNGLGIPWEQRQQALMKVMASKDVFEAYRKGDEYTNVKVDSTGQPFGVQGGQFKPIPGDRGFVPKGRAQGSGGAAKPPKIETYMDPETGMEISVVRNAEGGYDRVKVNGLNEPAPEGGEDPLKAHMDAQRAAGAQQQPANSLAAPEPAAEPAPSNALAEPAPVEVSELSGSQKTRDAIARRDSLRGSFESKAGKLNLARKQYGAIKNNKQASGLISSAMNSITKDEADEYLKYSQVHGGDPELINLARQISGSN